jgi:hypothetical protein
VIYWQSCVSHRIQNGKVPENENIINQRLCQGIFLDQGYKGNVQKYVMQGNTDPYMKECHDLVKKC